MSTIDYSENTLIEQPTIALFAELGWQTQNCYNQLCGPTNPLGRETRHDTILTTRLRAAFSRLKPALQTMPIGESRIVASCMKMSFAS